MPENSWQRPSRTQTNAETASKLLERARKARANPRKIYGRAPFGMEGLDAVTGGIGEDWMVMLAGRPAAGKSVMAIQFAESFARHFMQTGQDFWVKIASYELSPEEYLDRAACARAGVSPIALKQGYVSDVEFARYERVLGVLNTLPIEYTTAHSSLEDFKDFISTGRKTGVWILDHVGLLKEAAEGANYTAWVNIANRLATLCRRVAPGIVVTHLNRDSEKNKDSWPSLSNLGYADQFGRNAKLVLAVHRPDMFLQLPDDMQNEEEVAYLAMLKHTHGESKNIKMFWYPKHTMFMEAVSNKKEAKFTNVPPRKAAG